MYTKEYIVATIQVVVSTRYGGFGLSREAEYELANRKNWKVETYDNGKYLRLKDDDTHTPLWNLIPRHDPDLVRIVEEMGEKSWGDSAKLTIQTIQYGYSVDSRDGYESVQAYGTPHY